MKIKAALWGGALYICTALVHPSTSSAYNASGDAAAALPLLSTSESELESVAANLGNVQPDDVQLGRNILRAVQAAGEDGLNEGTLKHALASHILTPALDPDNTARLLAEQVANPENMRGALESGAPAHITQLLIPYMFEAGMCSGDLWSYPGLRCGYLSPSKDVSAAGEMFFDDEDLHQDLSAVPASSNLSRILDSAISKCQVSMASRSQTDLGTCFDLKLLEGRVVIARLSEAEFIAWYALLVKKYAEYLANPDPQKALSDYIKEYLLSIVVGEFMNLEVYGEYYIAANIRYFSDDSDSALAVYPFGYKCKLNDCKNFGKCASRRGSDAMICGQIYGEKRYWDIRPSGSYLQHSLAMCNALPVVYDTRLPYQAVQQDLYPLPYGLKFQTKHQKLASASARPALPTDRHLYPSPTSYEGPLSPYLSNVIDQGIPKWTFEFSKVRTWDYNLIFAGLKATPAGNYKASCSSSRWFNGNLINGTVFWTWHGQGQGNVHDCDHIPYKLEKGCPDYFAEGGSFPTPTVNLMWGLSLSHPVIACGQQPPCDGVNCLPNLQPTIEKLESTADKVLDKIPPIDPDEAGEIVESTMDQVATIVENASETVDATADKVKKKIPKLPPVVPDPCKYMPSSGCGGGIGQGP